MEMAELGSVNVTTAATPTTTKPPGLSIGEITAIAGTLIAALALLATVLGMYLSHRKTGQGNGQQRLPTEEEIELNPSNADTGTRHKVCCCFSRVVTVLERCQQQLIQYYKDTTSTIPAHPLDPSRTVAIDQFFSEVELTRKLEGNEMTQEPIHLQKGTRNVDKCKTKRLDSWVDMFQDVAGKLRILLSGWAGFGKSTLLLRVANASTDPNSVMAKFKLVFLVKLREMKHTNCVLEAIRDQILPNFKKAVLKKLIDDNEAETAFILDGLDEIPLDVLNSPTPEGGYGVKDILHNKVLRHSTVLVSTRPHMVDFAVKGFTHFARVETLGFRLETARKYITSYFAKNEADNHGKSLISHVTSNPLLQTLVQIPIIVLFLCIVWENMSKLPEKLTALYTEFVEVLVSRRCNEGEDKVGLMNKVLRGLGRVALDGLLDPKGERLVFSSEEFDEKDLKDGCRLGFLQQESLTSGLKKLKVVTFLHKSFQEFCAAYYFANLHHTDEDKFHESLKQINPDNVFAMKYLLQFACGISSGSPATGLILQYVQKQHAGMWHNKDLQNLVRLLLLESGSDEMADKLDRPTDTDCDSQEELLAMRNYLQCLRQPLVELEEFTVHCRSHEELALLSDIDKLLHDDTKTKIVLNITSSWHECLKLLREIPSSGNTRATVSYTMSEKANEESQRPSEMDERLCDQIKLELEIDEISHFDEYDLGSLSRVGKQIIEAVSLRGRPYDDVIRLGNALDGFDRLNDVRLCKTNLHGHLGVVAPLVLPSLKSLSLRSCGLNDDDVPDLISLLPVGHGLQSLNVDGNAFSADGVDTLTTHLKNLPLELLLLFYIGDDAERVEQVVERNLPHVTFS
ncbi:uncharacterized protein LOC119739607 [Patiria miniata]|uniref:NACHT domain-containing protein n=1 Tax=Patiria miniata TaxID=46514 RepID=A0A914B4V2_PATMI|nr:uncharacterized protein LOC119739607 [Patiria miniata]